MYGEQRDAPIHVNLMELSTRSSQNGVGNWYPNSQGPSQRRQRMTHGSGSTLSCVLSLALPQLEVYVALSLAQNALSGFLVCPFWKGDIHVFCSGTQCEILQICLASSIWRGRCPTTQMPVSCSQSVAPYKCRAATRKWSVPRQLPFPCLP